MMKVKLVLMAFCLCAIGASQLYVRGINDGIAKTDQEAFDSYVHFARQMKQETHKHHKTPPQETVWDAIDKN